LIAKSFTDGLDDPGFGPGYGLVSGHFREAGWDFCVDRRDEHHGPDDPVLCFGVGVFHFVYHFADLSSEFPL
jgi:hypothetical protein